MWYFRLRSVVFSSQVESVFWGLLTAHASPVVWPRPNRMCKSLTFLGGPALSLHQKNTYSLACIFWGKNKKIDLYLQKEWGKWKSYPCGTVRLVRALVLSLYQRPHIFLGMHEAQSYHWGGKYHLTLVTTPKFATKMQLFQSWFPACPVRETFLSGARIRGNRGDGWQSPRSQTQM